MANTRSGVRRSTIPLSIRADLFEQFWEVAEYWQEQGESLSQKIAEAFIAVGKKEQDEREAEIDESGTFYCCNCAGELKEGEDTDNCSNCKKQEAWKERVKKEAEDERKKREEKERRKIIFKQLGELAEKEDGEKSRVLQRMQFEVHFGKIPLDNPELVALLEGVQSE